MKNSIKNAIFFCFPQDGSINFVEFISALSVTSRGSLDEKLECKYYLYSYFHFLSLSLSLSLSLLLFILFRSFCCVVFFFLLDMYLLLWAATGEVVVHVWLFCNYHGLLYTSIWHCVLKYAHLCLSETIVTTIEWKKIYMKEDHCSYRCNFSVVKRKPEKPVLDCSDRLLVLSGY